ncbi:MAG: SufE family protein [Alphaproteobacteria bacterium]|nr:SufE family protein [Alphaproteobacteria bacterium]
MTKDELFENFSYLSTWEEKYSYLIDLGNQLPPFKEEDKTDQNKVEGCMSQVWFTHKKKEGKNYFNATSDALIVKGLEAVLIYLINEKTDEEILNLDLVQIFEELGLKDHLSPTRRNGFFAMIERIFNLIKK